MLAVIPQRMKISTAAASRHQWQIVWWSVFALAFVFVGAVPLENIRRQIRVTDQGPMNSTDAVFAEAIHTTHQRIAALVSSVPPERPVAIVFNDDDTLLPAAGQISALCWPRPAPLLRVPRSGGQLSDRLRATHAAAAFIISVETPADIPRGEAVSEELRFVLLP